MNIAVFGSDDRPGHPWARGPHAPTFPATRHPKLCLPLLHLCTRLRRICTFALLLCLSAHPPRGDYAARPLAVRLVLPPCPLARLTI